MTALLPCSSAECRAQLPVGASCGPPAAELRGSVYDTSPGAAVSRVSVARQCGSCGAAVDAAGGGRPEYVGDGGLGGGQHRGEQRWQFDVVFACGAYDARQDLLGKTAGNSTAKFAARRSASSQRRRVVDQPAELSEQAPAGGSQTMVADTTGVAPVTQRESGL